MRALLLFLAVAACTGRELPRQHLPVAAEPTFTLYVSNQSFDFDPVNIRVTLDGELAVTGDFVVEGQHTWVPFELALEPGAHVLRAVSPDAGVELERTFQLGGDPRWGVLSFWFYDSDHYEPTPRQLSLDLLDEPPTFQ